MELACVLPYDYITLLSHIPSPLTCGSALDNHGVCNATTNECTCDSGWTGRSDWIDTEGLDCQVYLVAIRALWAINLFIVVFIVSISVPRILSVRQKFLEIRAAKKSRGQKYTLIEHRGLFSICIVMAIWFPAHVALALSKIIDPDSRTAIDPLPTALWYISRTGFYLSAGVFQPTLLDTLLTNDSKGKNASASAVIVARNYHFSYFVTISMIVIPIASFPNCVSGGTNLLLSAHYEVFFFAAQAVVMFSYSIQARIIRFRVSAILSKSHSLSHDQRTLELKSNLNNVQNEVIRQTMLQSFVYGFFAIWPFLWNKHNYLLPISHMGLPFIVLRMIKAVSGAKTRQKSVATHGTDEAKKNEAKLKNKKSASNNTASQPSPDALAIGAISPVDSQGTAP